MLKLGVSPGLEDAFPAELAARLLLDLDIVISLTGEDTTWLKHRWRRTRVHLVATVDEAEKVIAMYKANYVPNSSR